METNNKFQICSLKELKENGKKVAFVKGNRSLNTKNLSSKEESLQKYGMNLIPLMYIQGTKAVADGLKIVEPNSNNGIKDTNAKDYIVIIDGQHRYTAALNNGIGEENIYLFESYANSDTKELLATTNIDSYSWETADYAKGANLFNGENPFLKFVNELADNGYPVTTIGLILYGETGKLTKGSLAKMMTGEQPKEGYNLEFAQLFINSAKKAGFEDVFIAKRYLIKVVNRVSRYITNSVVCDRLSKLSAENRDAILKAKNHEKEGVIESILSDSKKE